MKLQHIAIIFVIIIVPISLVLSVYINNQIKTIDYQTSYNTGLINSTYDAIKAFQLNTANNMYSTISNSKIRDIEAAISVFYDSLGTSLGSGGYTEEELKMYVPALLFNLYDGYYIYSNYYDTKTGEYRYGLKPFIYYSCRYVKGSNYDFVVNYTLDNTITIIGKVNGNYVTKTGHLVKYNETYYMSSEILTEKLIILNSNNQPEVVDSNNNPVAQEYQYTVYNSQKIYKENNITADTPYNKRFFYYSSEYRKDYVNDEIIIHDMNALLGESIIHEPGNFNLYSDSAVRYYHDAYDFTVWVHNNLSDIKASDAVNSDGNPIEFATDIGTKKIFDTSASDNDPLNSSSTFNEHRMNVIRKSIEDNLTKAIASYSAHTVVGYEFAMPKLDENEWYKIENNICLTSFLQGLPIGGKVYNNYCVVSNDTNKEMVGNDSIYIIDSKREYHKPGCQKLINNLNNGTVSIAGAYASSEFKRKTVSLTGADANAHSQLTGTSSGSYAYYYPEAYTACYDCIVTASQTYSTDDIISDNVKDDEGNKINITNLNGQNLREWYLRALARCRYDLYLTNGYFGS